MTGQPYRCDRCGVIHNDDDLMPDCVTRDLAGYDKPITVRLPLGIWTNDEAHKMFRDQLADLADGVAAE